MQATCLLQHNNSPQNQFPTLQVLKSNKILFITSNQQYSFTFARNEKHSRYELKPPYNTMQATCLLQYHKTNHKHHNYNAYKYWNQIKYYSLYLIKSTHSHLQEMKNTPNMYLSHLITPCKPPACSNTTIHHKFNFQHHKYRAL